MGEWSRKVGLQTSHSPSNGAEEASRSSTCQPGSVSIRYSEMLLVQRSSVLDPWLESVEAFAIFSKGREESISVEASSFFLSSSSLLLLWSSLMVWWELSSEGMEMGEKEEESLIPVSKNLLCFWVRWLAVWMGRSHSLQRIARSSWQKRKARLSYKTIQIPYMDMYFLECWYMILLG